jgi:pimeloyl-ACP methyl ester carboxylesterase
MKLSVAFFTCFLSARIAVCLLPISILAAGPKGTAYHITVPKQGSMVADPVYHCWVPDSVTTLRCIIVHQHGCTREGDGPQMVNDLQWISFAKKWQAAFIAPSLTTGSNCGNWNNPNNGSSGTYLAALDTLAKRSGRPEIRTIPWVIWGHSGGSMWACTMLGKYPARIAAVIAQSCGADVSNTPATLKVPVLHHNGRKDICYNDSYFGNGRAKGALWAHAINPNPLWVNGNCAPPNALCWDTTMYGHAPWNLRMIAIPWMDIALTARLPDKAGDSVLKAMDTTNAWLGDTATRAVSSEATFTGNKLRACWFPNQRFALLWREYMLTGIIKDSTPVPPAPYNLSGTYSNNQIVLKWDADADVQEGIQTFCIYRNGTLLQKMQWPNAPATLFTKVKGFQRWEDGDQPDPSPAPSMTFTDNTVNGTGTYTYQISTVNWADMEGPKSAAIALKAGQVTAVGVNPSTVPASSLPSISLRASLGKGRINLPSGMIGIYDIRGRLLKSLNIANAGSVDINMLLGNCTENVVVVRKKAR